MEAYGREQRDPAPSRESRKLGAVAGPLPPPGFCKEIPLFQQDTRCLPPQNPHGKGLRRRIVITKKLWRFLAASRMFLYHIPVLRAQRTITFAPLPRSVSGHPFGLRELPPTPSGPHWSCLHSRSPSFIMGCRDIILCKGWLVLRLRGLVILFERVRAWTPARQPVWRPALHPKDYEITRYRY